MLMPRFLVLCSLISASKTGTSAWSISTDTVPSGLVRAVLLLLVLERRAYSVNIFHVGTQKDLLLIETVMCMRASIFRKKGFG